MKSDARRTHLFAVLCDGIASPQEVEQLNELLAASHPARLAYLEYLDLHSELARRGEFQAAIEKDGLAPRETTPIPFPKRPQVIAALAIAALVILSLTFWLMRDVAPLANPMERSSVATVGFVEDVQWNLADRVPRVGMALPPGPLALLEGKLGLKFVNGAELSIQAPATLDIRSPLEVYLSHGELAARVPESARGFAIRSDQLALVDIGTEFSMKLTDGKSGEVFVRDGEVVASLLGPDGSTLREHDGRTGERLRMDATTSVIEQDLSNTTPFLNPFTMESATLPINAAYVDAIRSADPVGYWRFETMEGGKLPNSVNDSLSATIHGDLQLEGVGNRVGVFGATGTPTLLQIEGGVPSINDERGYTLEAWVNPGAWQYATLLSLIQADFPPARSSEDLGENLNYLSVVELTRQTNSSAGLLHGDYRFRFLHRAPPGTSSGFNAFSDRAYAPHQWHHVVAVKRGSTMAIYLNGKLSRQIAVNAPVDTENLNLLIGGLRPWGYPQQRNFVGQMDEVALYDRPLSPEEILHHFELVIPHLSD